MIIQLMDCLHWRAQNEIDKILSVSYISLWSFINLLLELFPKIMGQVDAFYLLVITEMLCHCLIGMMF